MVSESTTDFAYCRAIINYQLAHAESCEIQAEYDYRYGAPIALFTMLWIEGYINHLIAELFPQHCISKNALTKFEYRKGTKGKFEYLTANLGLALVWPTEFNHLVEFRNRICHARVIDTELPEETAFSVGGGFVDSFELAMGTMTEVKARHAFTETFLTQLHDSIKNMSPENRQALFLRVFEKRTDYRDARLQGIKHPVYESFAFRGG